MTAESPSVGVVGGGPAGLWAAEAAALAGAKVTVYEANPSVGRKLLVAGRKGLNLTSAVDDQAFLDAYSGSAFPKLWLEEKLTLLGSAKLRRWVAKELGLPTFESSANKVYPEPMKGGPFLRRWLDRLSKLGVRIQTRHRFMGLECLADQSGFQVQFEDQDSVSHDRVILALGGASWPETGSDGKWVKSLQQIGLEISPMVAANCGWNVQWSDGLLAEAEGKPLKNLAVSAGEKSVRGELVITKSGLEGGPLYHLGPMLRAMEKPQLKIDFKPTFSEADLIRKMDGVKVDHVTQSGVRWKLCDATRALFANSGTDLEDIPSLASLAKSFPLELHSPRPLAEAISSAGGLLGNEVDDNLMSRNHPGLFFAGEMLDWEAPTGGFLLQGCFLSGWTAGSASAVPIS